MKARTKICIIGCGSWAAYNAKILNRLPDNLDLYFCSRDIQKARRYCNLFKGRGYFGDINSALEDKGLAAFLIFTPPHVHLHNIIAVADTDKYVLLQKPIAGSLEDAKKIVNICNEEKLKLMMAENFRFMPAIITIKKILDSNNLGSPVFINIQETNSYIAAGWRTKVGESGGGILIDLGIHYLSLLRYLFGEPVEAFALLPEFQPLKMEGESAISLMVKMQEGISCNINLAWGLSSHIKAIQTLNIICERGSIGLNFRSRFLNLYIGRKKKLIFLGFGDIFGNRALLKQFIHITKNNLPITLNHKTGLDDLSFVEIAYKSLTEKRLINARGFYLQNQL